MGPSSREMVEPGHPFQSSQLDRFAGLAKDTAMNQLGLVQAVDGLG
jgi:hypothetical protein